MVFFFEIHGIKLSPAYGKRLDNTYSKNNSTLSFVITLSKTFACIQQQEVELNHKIRVNLLLPSNLRGWSTIACAALINMLAPYSLKTNDHQVNCIINNIPNEMIHLLKLQTRTSALLLT